MTFEEILKQDGRLVYKTRGVSMLPMLHQNRDLVVIRPAGRLQKYDVALYKRGEAYVLHRVTDVKGSCYLIRGDNTYVQERVPKDAVIGVLTEFVRKGRKYAVSDRGYRIYVRIWCAIYPARLFAIRIKRLLRRAARTVRKNKMQQL